MEREKLKMEYIKEFFPGILLQKIAEKWDRNGHPCQVKRPAFTYLYCVLQRTYFTYVYCFYICVWEIVYRYIYICKYVMYVYIVHIYVKSWGCLYIIYCELCGIKGKLSEMGKKAELRFSSGYIQHTHNKDILGNCFYCLITECPCQRNKAFFSTTDYFVISGVH